MSRKLFVLILGAVVLGLVPTCISQDLIAWYKLDGDALDSSGNELHGTFVVAGGGASYVPGKFGEGLNFVGDLDNVNLGSWDPTQGGDQFTLAFWAKWGGKIAASQGLVVKRTQWPALEWQLAYNNGADEIRFENANDVIGTVVPVVIENEWVHIAVKTEGGMGTIYGNGEQLASGSIALGTYRDAEIALGVMQATGSEPYNGALDDVRFYSSALTQAQIQQAMQGDMNSSSNPNPATGALDIPRDMILGWAPGEFAATHNVYFGTAFNDVNDADRANPLGVLASQEQDANSFDPARVLTFGQTYYWRVDEVNGAPDFTVFKGNIWSFTVEPFSYPLNQPIIATASSSGANNTGPEKTVDGSGLNEQDQHSIAAADMWLSAAQADPWIQYEFDKAYKLHEMWVWNSNQLIEAFIGFGAKDVTIETSVDGAAWTVLEGPILFNQAPGQAGYTANTMVDFQGAMAKFVKITVRSGWGMMPQYGLSEVRFMYIPTFAREPQPVEGEVDVPVDTVLSWRAGREAASHQVALSTDQAAVTDGTAPVTITDLSRFDPGGLDLASTYYWRTTEVNEVETPSSHVGEVWSFSTPEYLAVDDFEGYNDDCGRIFFTWEDGFGHNGGEGIADCTVAPSNGNGSGSIVGNETAPFAETSILHSGRQAMPLAYDGVSEATRTFVEAQDWTQYGIKTLMLYFTGDLGNIGGSLYVKINNAKIPFDGNPAALSQPFWTQWNIAVDAVAADLARVNTLTIGVEGAGAQGILYVDDIRLYREAPEVVVPQDPGTDNLVAYYAMENNIQDGSGNGNHGTPEGDPAYASGITGMAMDFDGFDDRVDLGALDVVGSGITLSLWLNPESFVYDDTRLISKATSTSGNDHWWMLSTSGGGHVLRFRLKTDDGAATTTLIAGSGGVLEGEWTHAAATWDGSTMRIYQDLQVVGSTAKGGTAVAVDASINAAIGNQPAGAGDKHWDGLIDEVRIYNRGLSEAELLHVASGQ